MILARRVSLNNIQLDELDDRIIISGIEESAWKDTVSAVATAMADGQRITNKRRDSLDVTVKFRLAIRNYEPKRSGAMDYAGMQARADLLEKINGWAYSGGWLKVGYREKRRLMVTLAQAPGLGDPYNWTNEYSIVFRAYALPYWQSTINKATTAESITGANMFIGDTPGQIPAMLTFQATNISGKDIDRITLTGDNGEALKFSGLALKDGRSLVWDYLINDRICVPRARVSTASGYRNVMAALDPESSDMIKIPPQLSSYRVNVTASRAIKMSLYVRGLYL